VIQHGLELPGGRYSAGATPIGHRRSRRSGSQERSGALGDHGEPQVHPERPRALSEREDSVHKVAPFSESPTTRPRTSRTPSMFNPDATTTGRDATWWFTRPFW